MKPKAQSYRTPLVGSVLIAFFLATATSEPAYAYDRATEAQLMQQADEESRLAEYYYRTGNLRAWEDATKRAGALLDRVYDCKQAQRVAPPTPNCPDGDPLCGFEDLPYAQ